MEAVFTILAFFIPLALGWLVGQFFSFRGKWAERFDSWPIPILLVVAMIVLFMIVALTKMGYYHPYFAATLVSGAVAINFLLFLGAFMRWSKRKP